MDTERMKRVLERVYGPAAPTEEKKPPDALREAIRLEAEAAARLRYLMRTSRACQNAFGEALRRCETRRRALHAEFFLREGLRQDRRHLEKNFSGIEAVDKWLGVQVGHAADAQSRESAGEHQAATSSCEVECVVGMRS